MSVVLLAGCTAAREGREMSNAEITSGNLHILKCMECGWQGHFEFIFNSVDELVDTKPPMVCPSCGDSKFSLRVAIAAKKWKGTFGTTGHD